MTDNATEKYAPHQRTKLRLAPKVDGATTAPKEKGINGFNNAIAVKITTAVGSMWCAYAFAAIALISLPQAIRSHNVVTLVSWVSQTFLQLVLLSIIIVGQNVLAAASDKRAQETYEDAEAVLHESRLIQQHLIDQDKALSELFDRFSPPS